MDQVSGVYFMLFLGVFPFAHCGNWINNSALDDSFSPASLYRSMLVFPVSPKQATSIAAFLLVSVSRGTKALLAVPTAECLIFQQQRPRLNYSMSPFHVDFSEFPHKW